MPVATATCTRYSARQTFVALGAIPARRPTGLCDAQGIDGTAAPQVARKGLPRVRTLGHAAANRRRYPLL
jgi:hypothetical protein